MTVTQTVLQKQLLNNENYFFQVPSIQPQTLAVELLTYAARNYILKNHAKGRLHAQTNYFGPYGPTEVKK